MDDELRLLKSGASRNELYTENNLFQETKEDEAQLTEEQKKNKWKTTSTILLFLVALLQVNVIKK